VIFHLGTLNNDVRECGLENFEVLETIYTYYVLDPWTARRKGTQKTYYIYIG